MRYFATFLALACVLAGVAGIVALCLGQRGLAGWLAVASAVGWLGAETFSSEREETR